jgi:DNA-binding beta-propeller fold protein YncE
LSNQIIMPVKEREDPPQFRLGWGDFRGAEAIAVSDEGLVYVAHTMHNTVLIFDDIGGFLGNWGILGPGDGQFAWPRGIAVDGNGNVYVTDSEYDNPDGRTFFNHRLQKFTGDGMFLQKWGSLGSDEGQFRDPRAIALDGLGNVYVADTGNKRIQKFTESGQFIDMWEGIVPRDITVGLSGSIYVIDYWNGRRILKLDEYGAYVGEWGSEGTGDGQFIYPSSVAVDRLFVHGIPPMIKTLPIQRNRGD